MNSLISYVVIIELLVNVSALDFDGSLIGHVTKGGSFRHLLKKLTQVLNVAYRIRTSLLCKLNKAIITTQNSTIVVNVHASISNHCVLKSCMLH